MSRLELKDYLQQMHEIIDAHLQDAPEPEYKCPVCKDTGYITWFEEIEGFNYEFAKPCNCLVAERNAKRLERSGLAALASSCTFENFETPTAELKIVKKLAADYVLQTEGRWFYIGGQPGSGKTHICTAICNELMKRGRSVKYIGWRELVAEWNSLLNSEEGQIYVDQIKKAPVLYIDDLLKGSVSEGDKNKLFELVNYRYNNHLPTIFSTEIYLTELVDLDEAIASRIKYRCGDYIIDTRRAKENNYRLRSEQ